MHFTNDLLSPIEKENILLREQSLLNDILTGVELCERFEVGTTFDHIAFLTRDVGLFSKELSFTLSVSFLSIRPPLVAMRFLLFNIHIHSHIHIHPLLIPCL